MPEPLTAAAQPGHNQPGSAGGSLATSVGPTAAMASADPAQAQQGQSCAAPAAGTTVHVLGSADLDACLALDQQTLGGFWSREQWLGELSESGRRCCGLRDQEALVALACGWLVVDELHITLVAVAPALRRQGLGRRVLLALLRQARHSGATHATLEVATTNPGAQALYGSCGFSTAGVRRGYYRDGGDALIQWLNFSRLPNETP